MAKVSGTISRTALYCLILAGPILGLATKGFAALLTISGSLALIATLLQTEKLKKINVQKFSLALPFLIFAGLSLFWTPAENGYRSYVYFILVIIFTSSLCLVFDDLSEKEQNQFRHRLCLSLLGGIIVSVIIGSYPLFWPKLIDLTEDISASISFASFELVRQSNRSLALVTVFLFPLVGFYYRRTRWFFILLFLVTIFVIANSDSQTAFLAILLGSFTFIFGRFYRYDGRKLILFVTAICLLGSPLIFLNVFENKLVENYAPQIIKHKASGEYRAWIYYAYASKALTKPLIGHGIKSTKDFDTSNPIHHKMLRPNGVKKAENFQLELNNRVVAHAHNFPLQIIFEFGYLGALLFLMALWWLLNSNFTNCNRHVKAATLASVFGLLLFAYSFWQSWIVASLGFLYFLMNILYRPRLMTEN